jgi:hypothetical protein
MEIRACAEVLSLCCQYNGAALSFIIQRLERPGEGTNKVRIEKIVGSPLYLNGCDMIRERDDNISITCLHSVSPLFLFCKKMSLSFLPSLCFYITREK